MRARRELLDRSVRAKQMAMKEAQDRYEAQRKARVPHEREALMAVNPAFKRDFFGEYERLGRYAIAPDGGGLRPEEWDLVDDHRHINLVWKAREYDLATRKTAPELKKKLARKPQPPRSGSTDGRNRHTRGDEVAAAMARLKETGSQDALRDAFLAREHAKRAAGKARRGRT